ncbi:MAG: glycosyltransferase [Pseudomonadota bacterium]
MHSEEDQKPTVAIITRTKDRPILLKRAGESVRNQTYSNFQWVVVNDGGDEAIAREVVAASQVDSEKILFLSNEVSMGMEAASNLGIEKSYSDYIIIHDDDDSLEPEFLAKTVDFLQRPEGQKYGGVITKTIYVSEEISEDEIIRYEEKPFNDWIRNIQIAEMMAGNFFPPICFLFRRSIYDEIGGYDESLPVLGDWNFNLEFVLRSDIGVLLEPLAYYHHRDRTDASQGNVYSNSVIGGISKHEEYTALVRNKFLRKYSGANELALGAMFGYLTNELRNQTNQLRQFLGNDPSLVGEIIGGRTTDTADRSWLIASINWHLNHQSNIPFIGGNKKNLLPPDASWSQIEQKLKDLQQHIKPAPDFDDETYRKHNPDVMEAWKNGSYSSGYIHYILHGRKERRSRPTLS